MKKGISRILLLLLAIGLLLPAALPAAAAEPSVPRTVGGLSPLEEALYAGYIEEREEIGIEGLCESTEALSAAISHLLNAAPELFHVSTAYTVASRGGLPVAVRPEYRMTGRELAVARAEYLAALEEIVAEVDPTLSDYEIALFLHDLLCRRYAYDTTLSRFDAHSFLTEGTGVCQAYTLVYTALLSYFDIPVTYATGRANGVAHIWSILTLDGVHYHVDTTWGDPLRGGEDVPGLAMHDNFLRSDSGIESTGHTERVSFGGITADDDRYAGSLLGRVRSPFAFLDGDAYGMVDGGLYRFSDDLLEATLLYTVEEEWHTGGSMLAEKPAGVVARNRLLYISTPHAILTYDLASGVTEEVLSVGDRLILAFYGEGDTLSYLVADDINGTGSELLTHTLPAAVPPCTGEHSFTVYATLEPLCNETGCQYRRCTVCGERDVLELPSPPHAYTVTVVPPDYGTEGYTLRICPDCGDRVVDSYVDAIPLPSAEDYRTAVAAAKAAATPEELLRAVSEAREMEPHLDAAEIAADREELLQVIRDYDAAAETVNTDFGSTVLSALPVEGDLLAPTATLLGILILVFRRLFGL